MSRVVDTRPLVDYDGVLTPEERKRILTRIDSMFSWVGASTPDEVEVNGKVIPLKKTVENLIMKPELSEDDRDRIGRLIRAMGRKERSLRRQLKHGDISEDEAVEFYDELRGILRAVSRLRRLEDGELDEDVERSALMNRVDDERRWRQFVRKVR